MSRSFPLQAEDQLSEALGGAEALSNRVAKAEVWPRAMARAAREDAGSFGPYRFVRSLGECTVSGERVERFFAVHERDQSSHAVYRWPARKDHAAQRRLLSAIERVAAARGRVLLEIEAFALTPGGQVCVVTPYLGNQEGLMTLESHLEIKGGRLAAYEAERAAMQLLQALDVSHGVGLRHGALPAQSVLIDRHGKLWIEMHGMGWAIGGGEADEASVIDELTQIARLTFRMVTGVEARKNRAGQWLGASVMTPKLDSAWDAWFATNLTRPNSAVEMMATMPRVSGASPKGRGGARLAVLGLLATVGLLGV